MNKLNKEVLERLDLHDPLSAKYVRALQEQLATAREDALREALATIADLKAWPNAMYDDEAIMCGHEEAYRALEKLVEEKTK